VPVTWKNGAGINQTYNRILPICSMGSPSAASDWSQSYGGEYAVVADGYVFWTRSNRYIDKIDPADGSIVQTRDFGAGSNLAQQLCACDVAGVTHIYCTTAYNTSSALLRAIKVSDLTDYWTQAWTGCPAGGVLQNTFYAFETASGVLILASEVSPNYYWRAIKDSGATAAYFWTSTLATSGAKSAVLLGDKIYGIASGGGSIRAVKAVDGTSSILATQTNIASGSALVLSGVRGYGICLINASAPYKFRKFQLSDGLTPVLMTDLTLTSGAVLYATINNEGLWYFADGTKVYCYDEFWNKAWEYTNAETVTRVWVDLEQNVYVMSASNLRCVSGVDQTVRWTIAVPAALQIVPVSDSRLLLYDATQCMGIAITRNEKFAYVDTFQRAAGASLGADWTDDYFFSDTGAHDYWSIDGNTAKVTGIAGAPNGGAYCRAAPACRDFDITVTFTAGVAPTGTKAQVGPIFRGVDGRTQCWFTYTYGTPAFDYRYQDNAAAGINTSMTLNVNMPVIASGGTVTLRVVCYRQPGYFWVNGQGPYEAAIGFLGELKFGMHACTAGGSAKVSEFRVYGNSNLPRRNELFPIWRATEIASAEYRGVSGNTHQIFRASDGRVLCFWQSRYTADSSSTWRRYWSYTSSPDDMTTWQAAGTINTTSSVGTWYGDQANGWMDANDNVYALFLTWGSGGVQTHFCKFTKTAGGWTAGSAVAISMSAATDNIGICKVPGTGRLWIAIPNQSSTMQMWYSDNEGANWTQITSPTSCFTISGTPAALHAWNSKVILLYKGVNPYPICSRVRDDTLADKNTWGSATTLWAAQSSGEGWHHGVWLLASNTADATFVLICKTSDGNLRAKKYLDASGWVAGDTVLAAQQPSGNYSRSYWDGTLGRAIAHHAQVNEPPVEYNPNGNGIARGQEEAPYYGSTDRSGAYTYSLIKRGAAGTGAVGVFAMRMRYAAANLSLLHQLQLEESAGLVATYDLPGEWHGLPLFWVCYGAPLEIMGEQVYGVEKIPLDTSALLMSGTKDGRFESRHSLWVPKTVPLDAWGIWNALLHRWRVNRNDPSALLHLWEVLQKAGIGSLPHSWTVLTQEGEDLQHLWRVIEPQLIILHGRDIQLPFAKIEKVE
jgi:hypothetical protein